MELPRLYFVFEGVLLAMLLDEYDMDKKRYTVLCIGILAVTLYAFRNRFIGEYYSVVGFLIYPELIFLLLRSLSKAVFLKALVISRQYAVSCVPVAHAVSDDH